MQLKSVTAQQQAANNQLAQRNQALSKQIHSIQSNQTAIESLARQNLGMIKDNETYYQFVHSVTKS